MSVAEISSITDTGIDPIMSRPTAALPLDCQPTLRFRTNRTTKLAQHVP
jgi:hypothetical protein